MSDLKLEKRTQKERLTIALDLLDSVWAEYTNGQIEDYQDNFDIAINAQIAINRIMWKLNEVGDKDDE